MRLQLPAPLESVTVHSVPAEETIVTVPPGVPAVEVTVTAKVSPDSLP